MTYITARFGVPVAKPKPPEAIRRYRTEDELAAAWIALAVKEGHIIDRKAEGCRKRVSADMMERVLACVTDQPTSTADIAKACGVSEAHASCALAALLDEGKARYDKYINKAVRRRLWSIA